MRHHRYVMKMLLVNRWRIEVPSHQKNGYNYAIQVEWLISAISSAAHSISTDHFKTYACTRSIQISQIKKMHHISNGQSLFAIIFGPVFLVDFMWKSPIIVDSLSFYIMYPSIHESFTQNPSINVKNRDACLVLTFYLFV